jgi:hypothetical protein
MARSTNGAVRLDATLTDRPTVERAERLMALLHTGNADLFRGALDVFDWCVRQVQDGRRIASLGDTGDTREFSTPLLEAARQEDRRIPLHGEAFDRVAELIAAPPKPTADLRELLGGS